MRAFSTDLRQRVLTAALLPGAVEQRVAERVSAMPDATDEEHRAWLAAERGVTVSRATVNRTLRRMGLTRKRKNSAPTSETGRT